MIKSGLKKALFVFLAAGLVVLVACGEKKKAADVIASPVPSVSPVPHFTDTPVPEPTATLVPVSTNTPLPTSTNTPVPTPTDTPVPTMVPGSDMPFPCNFSLTNQLPIIYLTTEVEVTSKDEYVKGTLSTYNVKEKQIITDAPMDIRARGNVSLDYEKKSYKIKLESSAKLLGLGEGKAKQWCLIANYCDQSLLRNYTAYSLAKKLSNIAWSPDFKNVDLVVNGKYRGVYLLVEQIKEDKNRVNISEDTELGEDIGFLVQMSNRQDDGYQFKISDLPTIYMKTDFSSDPALAEQQKKFIKNYLTKCYNACKTGTQEEIEALIDVDSAVDIYLLEEFTKNTDAGYDSFYFYKNPGEKLVFGPVWDFDIAMGNDYRLDNGSPEGVYVGEYREDFKKQQNKFLLGLMKKEWFVEKVKLRWAETRTIFENAAADVNKEYLKAPEAFALNFERWHEFGARINMEPDHIRKLHSHEAHEQYLENWLNERFEWMDKEFAN